MANRKDDVAIQKDEFLRMTPIRDEAGRRLVDMRIWKRTPTGGMPTNRAIVVEQAMVTRMVTQLQKLHRSVSSTEAREQLTTDPS